MQLQLLAALEAGVTVVTATRRLARYLKAQYNARQRSQQRLAWPSPDILAWSAWVQRLWDSSLGLSPHSAVGAPELLLSPAQEVVLWEGIIASSVGDTGLLHIPATARRARDAWYLMHDFKLAVTDERRALSQDAAAFVGWANEFAVQCDRGALLDGARLGKVLAEGLGSGAFELPQRLVLAGFDALTPHQEDLLAAIAQAGCTA